MKKHTSPLTDEQKDYRKQANLLFQDAHRKAKSLKRISRRPLKRQRTREVLARLKEGLRIGEKAKRPRM